jgi:hypothetical protein
VSSPSGTDTASATRPSVCSIRPTGPRGSRPGTLIGGARPPRSASAAGAERAPGTTAEPAPGSGVERLAQVSDQLQRPIGQLRQPPHARVGPAPQEGRRGGKQPGDRRPDRQPQPAVLTAEQQRDALVGQGEGGHVGPLAGHVAPAVIQREQEPAGQRGQLGVGAQPAVQLSDQRADVQRTHPVAAGQRRGQHVARPVVRHRGQQPLAGQPGGQRHLGTRREAAQLQVAPGGQLQPAVAELGGQAGEPYEFVPGQGSAGDPDAGQPAVLRLVYRNGSRATVGAAALRRGARGCIVAVGARCDEGQDHRSIVDGGPGRP